MGIFNINNNDKYSNIIKNSLRRNDVNNDKIDEIFNYEREYFNFIKLWDMYNKKYNEYSNNIDDFKKLEHDYLELQDNYVNASEVHDKIVPNEYINVDTVSKYRTILDNQMNSDLSSINDLTPKVIEYYKYMDDLQNDINRIALELNDAYFVLLTDYKDYFNEDYFYDVIGNINNLVSAITIGIQSSSRSNIDDNIIRENINNTINNEVNLFNKILEQVNNIKDSNLTDALTDGNTLFNVRNILDDETKSTSDLIDVYNKYGESHRRKDKKNIQNITNDYLNKANNTNSYCDSVFNYNEYTL